MTVYKLIDRQHFVRSGTPAHTQCTMHSQGCVEPPITEAVDVITSAKIIKGCGDDTVPKTVDTRRHCKV